MRYLELVVRTTTEASEMVAYLACEEGATGVSIIDKADIENRGEYAKWDTVDDDLLNAYSDDVLVKATFGSEGDEQLERAKARILELDTFVMTVEEHDDSEWADAWKAYFKPFRVGSRIVVKPAWEEADIAQGDVVLDLDPGMAFGTGTHATTSLCLELLERYVKGTETVADVGCGSGILAIAAMKLGASRALACDFDPDAVKVARENILRNGLQDKIVTRAADLILNLDDEASSYINGNCDLMLANILPDIIKRLIPLAKTALRPNGVLICSGIVTDRLAEVEEVLTANGFGIAETKTSGDWVAIAAVANEE
ncbi:MAG: 50S ribosomal protein L11 methyltransferase [Oscillospiraceae bacterium]|jgi:ribosomal protein L11 methyltransferase|nr:50S ribosomal protein L11 methyltransferase [Oscillospiraceae bacterium]